jgi:subtilisin family serine protease
MAQQDQPKAPATPAAASAEPGAKIPVITAADLPVHVYSIKTPPSDFIESGEPFKAFVAKVRTNIESDLAKYDIKDPTTLKGYEQLRMQIAMVEGRMDDIPAIIERVRALETKESARLMTGQVALSMLAARKSAGAESGPAFEEAFKKELATRVGALPWETVGDDVKAANGRAQIMRRELMLGQVKAGLDPVAATSQGQLSSDIAHDLVGMRAALDTMIPLQPLIASVYGEMIATKDKATKGADVWSPTLVELTGKEGGTPVVVAIWDSGVDVAIFKDQLFTNAKEVAGNAQDDDANGFVDDVHGIAFDLRANPIPELLHPVTEMKNDVSMVMKHTKGLGDLESAIESPEASELRKYISTLSQDQIGTFLEDLWLAGNYSHGTHVAGIAAAGNPYARLLPARITFNYKMIPQITPTTEQAKKDAEAAAKTVAYFKQAGVRVVNMSWGGGVKDTEEALEKKGEGATPEARNAKARELFAIQRDALQAAITGAPDILFIAAAGNDDNDNVFAEMIPSALSAPNLITVGAVDDTLKPTSFTTFGKNVQLYANGFEVESYVPGGQRMKLSGTSMAAPNVANLAAKLVALAPDLTPTDIIDLMKQGATPMKDDANRMVINPRKSIDLVLGKK